MRDRRIYPLLFEPELRHYIWGGRNLETLFGRDLPPGKTAESWEISAHPEAPTEVITGYWRGRTLPQVLDALGTELAGTRWQDRAWSDRFPLLIKLLDAHRDLSVQVHPDDDYARQHEQGDPGKTECWYVLAAEPGVEIIYGLAEGVTQESFRQAIDSGKVVSQLARLPVKAGDCVYVPSGTLHALTAGTVVTEIQQNSDATYRVYDWGRVGADGKPRELHIDKAMDVIDWEGRASGIVRPNVLKNADGCRRALLVDSQQFVVESMRLEPGAIFSDRCQGETFEIWGCIEGAVDLEWEGESISAERIRFFLLPAALGEYTVRAKEKSLLLRTYLGA